MFSSMKKIVINIALAIMFLLVCSCSSNLEQSSSPKTTKDIESTSTSIQEQEPDPSWGMFDNVASVEVFVDNNLLYFNNEDAMKDFIDKIRLIEEADELELQLGRYERQVNDVEELYDEKIFGVGNNPFYKVTLSEELLGISCVSLNIEYNDGRKASKIYEFIDGDPEIFNEGKGIKVVYDGETAFYENEDYIITRSVVEMIKDTLHYVHVYDNGNYSSTSFLQPYEVKTDNYTIEGEEWFQAFLMEYWEDYIAKQNFIIYENGEIVDVLPEPDGVKKHELFLVDEKGNTYQYAYDRRDAYGCIRDGENYRRYYCEY